MKVLARLYSTLSESEERYCLVSPFSSEGPLGEKKTWSGKKEKNGENRNAPIKNF